MKKFAVFFLATVMSAVSCKKEPKPDIETPTEKPSDNDNTSTTPADDPDEPGDPVYEASFGELVLKAAAPTHDINGYDRGEEGTVFYFAEPFHVDSLDTDLANIGVLAERILSLEDDDETVTVTFADESSASLKYQDAVEIRMENEPEQDLLGYPGTEYTYNYKATKIGHGSLEFSIKTEGEIEAENTYDTESREGVLKVILPEEASSTGKVDLSFTDGFNDGAFIVTASTYSFSVEVEPVTLGGALAATADLTITVTSDIPDVQIVITPAENAFFSVKGETLTVTSENRTGQMRASYVEISEASGKMPSYKVDILQDFIEEREDVVKFTDIAFKNTMLALCDMDADGEVSFDEALTVKEIVAVGEGIGDLEGLQYFKNIEKLDLQENDIVDGSVLKELPLLHWLDLKGNKNLKTFDITRCSLYFEHCEFEVTNDLLYYCLRRQINDTYVSDNACEHSKHIEDTRNSVDYTHQDELRVLKEHTKGDGKKAIVFTGMGYIDVDINDGTWDRLVDRCLELIYQNCEELHEYWDYLDIYSISHITLNRYQYICPYGEDGFPINGRWQEVTKEFHNEDRDLTRKCYEKIFNDPVVFVNGMWQAHIDDDIALFIMNLNAVPLPNQPQTILSSGSLSVNSEGDSYNQYYPAQFKKVYSHWASFSIGLDTDIELVYRDFPPEYIFGYDCIEAPEDGDGKYFTNFLKDAFGK